MKRSELILLQTTLMTGVQKIRFVPSLPSVLNVPKLETPTPREFNKGIEYGIPGVKRWELSGTIELHNGNKAYLLKWLKPARLSRKLKKRIKKDIHRFFTHQKSYQVSALINWQKRFKIK